MGKGPRYNVAFKRRIQARTNYKMRRTMILSKSPRLVTRGSLKYFTVQLVEAQPEGDKTIVSVHSKELEKDFNWKAPCGNLPAAYLTGILLGKRALSSGIKEAILDIGLQKPTKGAKIFAVLKGAVDAGLDIPYNEDIVPDDSRITGEHIAAYAKQLSESDQTLYATRFSKYLEKGLKPEDLVEYVNQVKEDIMHVSEKGEKND
jgi:large subunit ribosomal protein L18